MNQVIYNDRVFFFLAEVVFLRITLIILINLILLFGFYKDFK